MGRLRYLSVASSLCRRWAAFLSTGVSYPVPQNGSRNHVCSRCFSSQAANISECEVDQLYYNGVMEKDAALHHALSGLVGDFDKESMLSLPQFFHTRSTPVISTGSLKLDMALGIGGLPKGRIVEIYGQEASGKTTLALHVVKEAQKLGGYCAYFDTENAFNPLIAEAVGVNTENLLFAGTNSAENSLCAVDTLIKSGSIDVLVVDSIAALVPQCEIDGVIPELPLNAQSRLMTQALRKIQQSLCRSGTLVIFVNQVRSDFRSPQVVGHVSEVTCGGNALKFHSAIRLRIARRGLLGIKHEINGISISVQVVKNKLAPSSRKAELQIAFGKGICRELEVLDLASKYGVISKEGEGYYVDGRFFRDSIEAEQYLSENDGVLDELVRVLRSLMFGKAE